MEEFHKIRRSVAELFRQIKPNVANIVNYNNTYNTPTGASTNPKNIDLNKNLNMNLI